MDGKIGDRKAEIYTYESDNVVYGLSWSVSHYPLRYLCRCTVVALVVPRLLPWLMYSHEGLGPLNCVCRAVRLS